MRSISIGPSIRGTRWMGVLVPLVVLALYSLVLSWFLSWLLPEDGTNVNAVFLGTAWKVSLAAIGVYLVFLVVYLLVRGQNEHRAARQETNENIPAFRRGVEKLDFVLILLPLTPVVQYVLNNQDILSLYGSLYVVAVFVAFSAVPILLIPALLGFTGTTKTLMILGMAFTFTITNMASLSSSFHWFEVGNFVIQVLLLGAVFAVGWVLYHVVGRKFLYLAVAVLFVVNTAIQFVPGEPANAELPGADNKLVELVGSREPVSRPNIYLLVYDSYVVNETMLGYGIDNSSQEEYLETLGFQLYPHTYTVGANSLSSMSRTLNASTDYYGNARRGASGDGVVHSLLKSFGYETYGIFEDDYFFQGIGSSYDVSFPEGSSSPGASSGHEVLVKGIFMGEFRFDLELTFSQTTHDQFLERKLGIFEDVPDRPRFIYTHGSLPNHSQNSGACRPNETELFQERLTQVNREMKEDIETITQKDPAAIIIVAGDHGPALTKNCTETGGVYDISEISRLDIQDRYGTFLAIRWPDQDYARYDDITVLQDLFPAIFAYLFEDAGLLEAKAATATLQYEKTVSGVMVKEGIIHGGVDDGEPLFVGQG